MLFFTELYTPTLPRNSKFCSKFCSFFESASILLYVLPPIPTSRAVSSFSEDHKAASTGRHQ